METIKKYHLSRDGNEHGLFDSIEAAEKYAAIYDIENNQASLQHATKKGLTVTEYVDAMYSFWLYNRRKYHMEFFDALWFITEVEFNQDGEIIKVYEQDFNEYMADNFDVEDDPDVIQRMKAYYKCLK